VKLEDKILIQAKPDAVWKFIEDPAQVARWNPKLVQVTPISTGPRRMGWTYKAAYQMRERSEVLMEIQEYQAPRKWMARGVPTGSDPQGQGTFFVESYELEEKTQGTLVKQTIHMTMPNLFILWRILIWLVMKFGKPKGNAPKYLENLKHLVETES
jgi:carbon monoxide dehydrogenase subunit G